MLESKDLKVGMIVRELGDDRVGLVIRANKYGAEMYLSGDDFQLARYGVDDSMTYGLDSYLVDHIAKLLRQYLEDSSGVVDLKYSKHPDGRTQEQWVVDTIKAFEKYKELMDVDRRLTAKEERELLKFKEEMKDLFGELFESLWW